MPTAVAIQCVDATTPNEPVISGRVVKISSWSFAMILVSLTLLFQPQVLQTAVTAVCTESHFASAGGACDKSRARCASAARSTLLVDASGNSSRNQIERGC